MNADGFPCLFLWSVNSVWRISGLWKEDRCNFFAVYWFCKFILLLFDGFIHSFISKELLLTIWECPCSQGKICLFLLCIATLSRVSQKVSVTLDTQRSDSSLKKLLRLWEVLALTGFGWHYLDTIVMFCGVWWYTVLTSLKHHDLLAQSDSGTPWRQWTRLGLYLLQEPSPVFYSLFPIFKPIIYAVTLCLTPWLLSFPTSISQETLPGAF